MIQINPFAGQEQRHRHLNREQTFDHAGEGEGEMNCRSSIDIYTAMF